MPDLEPEGELMLSLLVLWMVLAIVSYHYFHHLFSDLGLSWRPSNRVMCSLLSVAGPAAMVLALVVDATRPLHSIA